MGWIMVPLPNVSKEIKDRLVFGLLFSTIAIIFWALSWQVSGVLSGEAELKINFYDVGQGDAILIQKGDLQILIDGGPDEEILNALGRDLPPWDRTIELMILTHPHADHLAGLNPVIERYKVEKFLYYPSVYDTQGYKKFLDVMEKEHLADGSIILQASAGGDLWVGEVHLQILWPTDNYHSKNVNNESVVALLSYEDFEVLLLGEVEQEAQANFLSSIKEVELIKISHHGSWNGTYEPLLRLARPQLAVIPVGVRNTYGHPHQSTLNLLERLGISILRTDISGTIRVQSDGKSFWYHTER